MKRRKFAFWSTFAI